MKRPLLLTLAAFTLAGCGATPASSQVPSSLIPSADTSLTSKDATPTDVTTVTSTATTTATTTSASTAASSSSSSEDSSPWTLSLTSDSLEATGQSQYLNDYSFTVARSDGVIVPFYGDYIQKGTGSYAGSIQMKKQEGYLYSKAALPSCHVSVGLMIRGYGDNDYTGVPTFYVGETEDPATVKDATSSDKEGIRVFEFDMEGYFKVADLSSNAIYITSIEFASL